MAKKKTQIDLTKIDGFVYALQKAPDKLRERLQSAMEAWAAATKSDYDTATGYGSGFSRAGGKQSFSKVEKQSKESLRVSVGHASYIARFLEVGTKAHDIAHKQGKGWAVAHVMGIRGSKALSKAWNKRQQEITAIVEREVNAVITQKS